jgi:hypothetical protein
MPISVDWYDDEHTIIFMDLTRRWSWTDAAEAITQLHTMCEEAKDPIYAIVDSHNVNWLLPDYGNQVLRLGTQLPANIVLVVHIGNDFLQQVISAFDQVYPESFNWKSVLVRTSEQALAAIDQHRKGRHWHSAPYNPNVN